MIIIFIVSLAVIALLLDWFIYKTAVTPCNKRWLKRIYIIHVIAIDIMTVLALLFYHKLSHIDSQSYMHGIMWIVYLFMLFIVPKLFYGIFLLLDVIVGALMHGRLYLFRWIGGALALVAFCFMLWGATGGRNNIRVSEVTITSDKLPKSFDGYRLVLFADVHIGNLPENHKVMRKLVDRINSLQPNMTVHAGDLVNRDARELVPEIMAIFSGINSRDGIYSVYGNHDLGLYMPEGAGMTPTESVQLLREKQEAMGWTLLENESRYVYRNGDSIAISGVGYPHDGSHNGRNIFSGDDSNLPKTYEGITDATYNILVSHTPNSWDKILAYGKTDLTLAGHVHAMQTKLHIGNWQWSPAKWLFPRWSGLYREGDKYLYVNDGIGYVMYPMRVGTNPELTLITLKSPQ